MFKEKIPCGVHREAKSKMKKTNKQTKQKTKKPKKQTQINTMSVGHLRRNHWEGMT